MSSSGWPDVPKKLTTTQSHAVSISPPKQDILLLKRLTNPAPPISHQYGLVLWAKPSNPPALGRMAGWSGCWGIVGALGSSSPGMRSTLSEGKTSSRKESSAAVGSDENKLASYPYRVCPG